MSEADAQNPRERRARLTAWRKAGAHLPAFMRDFHDQKLLFRYIHWATMPQKEEDRPSWVAAQIYTIDTFLWCMARHGFTLQKSSARLAFEPLDEALAAYQARHNDQLSAFLAPGPAHTPPTSSASEGTG